MGIFQRFEDEGPSILIAVLLAVTMLLVLFPLTFYVFDLMPATNRYDWELAMLVSFSTTGAVTAITLGKLRKP